MICSPVLLKPDAIYRDITHGTAMTAAEGK